MTKPLFQTSEVTFIAYDPEFAAKQLRAYCHSHMSSSNRMLYERAKLQKRVVGIICEALDRFSILRFHKYYRATFALIPVARNTILRQIGSYSPTKMYECLTLTFQKLKLFGKLTEAQRPRGKPKRRYRDHIQRALLSSNIDSRDLEDFAEDRSVGDGLVPPGVEALVSRAQQQQPLPTGALWACLVCGRHCRSAIGLFSHQRTHQS